MSSISRSIAVFGGNGFLGRKICETGIQLGYKVTSFSRSGKAPSSIKTPWVEKVNWEKANIFDPETYKHKLKDVDTVVHSIGILFENQGYKQTVNTNFNFLNDIQNLANTLKYPNPMTKDNTNTYEAIQRDSALILANAFLKQHEVESKQAVDNSSSENSSEQSSKLPSFVYISADQKIPMVPSGYIETKREAELELSCLPGLRTIIMRPNFMYDEAEKHGFHNREILRNFFELGYNVKEKVIGNNVSYINSLIRPPISIDVVARTIYDKLDDESFKGIVTLDEMRRGM
ncbi:Piso0_002425 [Millerozyma farinosa CBS 7064]|uniref:Piso0_002425 protein n=1 Tax=Pichia sorbitophila (strain ATCC MYA-4447 / BCRC 22081 / CBS 7064 / NBRC 10061 / NRRL Y-12695) TaxID=559304 RepID=G8YF08_PICSO|nr:Piso0_002425 [Millerozyma farinosa CBS 7064]